MRRFVLVLGPALAMCLLAGPWGALGAQAAQAAQAVAPAAAVQSPGVSAADSALDARTSVVAAKLRCPVCQGLSIQASPSELAQQMRSVVKEQLAAGRSPEQVQAYFVSKYGEWILLAPAPRGLNLIVYVLPVLLVFGGLLAIALAVRKWSAAPAKPLAP